MEARPLALSEFIGPLSYCDHTDNEGVEIWDGFTDYIMGDDKRRANERRKKDGGGSDPKKGKAKAKKKGR